MVALRMMQAYAILVLGQLAAIASVNPPTSGEIDMDDTLTDEHRA